MGFKMVTTTYSWVMIVGSTNLASPIPTFHTQIEYLKTDSGNSFSHPDLLLFGWVAVVFCDIHLQHKFLYDFSYSNPISWAINTLVTMPVAACMHPLLVLHIVSWYIGWLISWLISWWDSFDCIQKKHNNTVNSPAKFSAHTICHWSENNQLPQTLTPLSSYYILILGVWFVWCSHQ